MAKFGRPAKIDLDLLEQMISVEGKTLTQCAKHFNVSISAISQQRKKLGIVIKKNVARSVVTQRAPMIEAKRLDAIEQLQKINNNANEMLDLCMKWIKGDDVAIQALESCVRKVNVGSKKAPILVDGVKFKDPHEIALSSMSEIRNQLRLQLEIFKTLYDAEAVREFQNELIALLGETSPELRDKFIQRLREKGVVRSILEFAGPTVR
jgi:hypothetical protein